MSWDLVKYLMVAQRELGDLFDFEFTIRQYFDEVVYWEWQGELLVFEDRIGQWHIVPDNLKEYVTKTTV